MNPLVNTWSQVAVIIGGYLLGIYFQNRSIAHLEKRVDDLRVDHDRRFTDLNSRFADLNNGISDLKDFIRSEVKRLEDRLDRLEHPIIRQ